MLKIEEGKDYIIEDRNELPYQVIGNLGHGHSGNVEKIQHVATGEVYACKTIRIYGARLKDSRRKIFDNEIKIIRSLAGHHHVIRVFATYVSKREVGLILQPVADQGDLEDFLGNYSDNRRTLQLGDSTDDDLNKMTSILERAFGCLASGLAFMHQQKIRHKDVKPRNILVHRGSVVYTDFGYSLDSSQLDYSTTYGRPDFLTRRYSAPEVIDHDRRNSLSDVYSLGCVFMDIFAALTNSFEIPSDRCFYEVINSILDGIQPSAIPPRLRFLVGIIFSMTLSDLSKRPPAREAASKIVQHKAFSCNHCQPISTPDLAADRHVTYSKWVKEQATKRLAETMASLDIKPSTRTTETLRVWQEREKKEQQEKLDRDPFVGRTEKTLALKSNKIAALGLLALVLYDYKSAEDNEIDLREDECVTNIEKVDEDWWMGSNSSGDRGLFPANYVTMIENGNEGDSQETLTNNDSVVEKDQLKAPSASAVSNNATATALYDYDAAEDNELTFPEGSKITDLEFPDEDWWFGKFNGESGLFPANYVKLDG